MRLFCGVLTFVVAHFSLYLRLCLRFRLRSLLNLNFVTRALRNARDFHTRSVGLGSSSLCMNCHFCSIMRIIRRTSPHIPHSLKNRQMLSTAAASVTSVMIVAISIMLYIPIIPRLYLSVHIFCHHICILPFCLLQFANQSIVPLLRYLLLLNK